MCYYLVCIAFLITIDLVLVITVESPNYTDKIKYFKRFFTI